MKSQIATSSLGWGGRRKAPLVYTEHGALQVMSECLGLGDIFMDIGASVGQMALHVSELVGSKGKVLAFEPDPQRYSEFIAAIAINKKKRHCVSSWSR